MIIRSIFLLVLGLVATTLIAQVDFTGRTVVTNRQIPWDMLEGPDGTIWYTERIGLVSRVDPDTRRVDTLYDMRNGILNLVEVGLLSMVLHPDFADSPYVYLSYVYRDTYEWVKHVSRYRFDGITLVDEQVLYELRPAELWHQGCRMLILPDRTLMFTNGDQPAPDSTYSPTSEIGKILRINLDGTIPSDNPYPNNRVWSRGHRNPQGLCMLPNGLVFSSEHGDKIEDEINLIRKDGNYGWPKVEGMCDKPEEQEFCAANGVIEPIWSSGYVQTFAPAGLEYYGHARYPALTGKLLSTHLKSSRLMAHTLSDDQERITETTHLLQYRFGRIRDVLVTKNGRIFLCTGNVGYKNIEPFPKQEDDIIVELMPIWSYTKPLVTPKVDTIVFRSNPGDTVRSFAPFCNTTDATVRYLAFETNPGNIVQQRHWQDAATTEGANCWPFRILYLPDSAYPHVARATVWYDNNAGGRDSSSATIIGLPLRGLLVGDTLEYSASTTGASCSYTISLRNIGDTAVTIRDVTSNSAIVAELTTPSLPIIVPPGQSLQLAMRIDSAYGRSVETVVTCVTDGLRNPSFKLQANFTQDTNTAYSGQPYIAPFPIRDALVIRNVPRGSSTIRIHDIHGRELYNRIIISDGTIQIPCDGFVTTADMYGVYTLELIYEGNLQRYMILTTR